MSVLRTLVLVWNYVCTMVWKNSNNFPTYNLSFIRNTHMTLVWSSMNVTNHLAFVMLLTWEGPIRHCELMRKVERAYMIYVSMCFGYDLIIDTLQIEFFLGLYWRVGETFCVNTWISSDQSIVPQHYRLFIIRRNCTTSRNNCMKISFEFFRETFNLHIVESATLFSIANCLPRLQDLKDT